VVGEDCWILKVAVRDTVHLEEVLDAVSALAVRRRRSC
jgi:Lrp/AsnC family transcriptional regulator, leucine-responsive regulatory protein